MISEFIDRQATNVDLFELEDVETGQKKQYRIVSKATVTQPGTDLNKATFDPILEEIDGKLSESGGQLKGDLVPYGTSINLGSSGARWQMVCANTINASNGAFTNLMVNSQGVWSNAGITTQSVVVSGGSTGNSYTITLYKIGRLVVVNAAPWMDFGTIAANTVIGTLPSGWRPAADTYGAFVDPLHSATIKFLANGNISTNSDTSVQYCGFLCGTAYMTP